MAFPPGRIQNRSERVDTPNGAVLNRVTFIELPDKESGFFVWYMRNASPVVDPDERVQFVADTAAKGLASASKGRVLSSNERAVGNRKAQQRVVEGVVQGKHVKQHVLYVLTSDYLYQIMWVGKPATASEADIEAFFGSFSVVE